MPETVTAPSRRFTSRLRDTAATLTAARWLLMAAGLLLFHVSLLLAGDPAGLWFVPPGLGMAFVAWFGPWFAVPLFLDVVLTQLIGGQSFFPSIVSGALLSAQIVVSWWCYHTLARGTRLMDDPRSAVLFLLVVPGIAGLLFALLRAGYLHSSDPLAELVSKVGAIWMAAALGILVFVPVLLVNLSPPLVEHGLAVPESRKGLEPVSTPRDWTWGNPSRSADCR